MNSLLKPIDELATRGALGMGTAIGSSAFSRFMESSQPVIAWVASIVGLLVGLATLIYVVQGVVLRMRALTSQRRELGEDKI